MPIVLLASKELIRVACSVAGLSARAFRLQGGRFTVSHPAFSRAYCALDAMIVLFLGERKVQEQGGNEPLYGGKFSLE